MAAEGGSIEPVEPPRYGPDSVLSRYEKLPTLYLNPALQLGLYTRLVYVTIQENSNISIQYTIMQTKSPVTPSMVLQNVPLE